MRTDGSPTLDDAMPAGERAYCVRRLIEILADSASADPSVLEAAKAVRAAVTKLDKASEILNPGREEAPITPETARAVAIYEDVVSIVKASADVDELAVRLSHALQIKLERPTLVHAWAQWVQKKSARESSLLILAKHSGIAASTIKIALKYVNKAPADGLPPEEDDDAVGHAVLEEAAMENFRLEPPAEDDQGESEVRDRAWDRERARALSLVEDLMQTVRIDPTHFAWAADVYVGLDVVRRDRSRRGLLRIDLPPNARHHGERRLLHEKAWRRRRELADLSDGDATRTRWLTSPGIARAASTLKWLPGQFRHEDLALADDVACLEPLRGSALVAKVGPYQEELWLSREALRDGRSIAVFRKEPQGSAPASRQKGSQQ